jgi:hypothetical protein
MATVTLAPDVPLARMRVVVDDAHPGSDLLRVEPGGGEYAVRAGSNLVGDVLVDDYECPLGVPVVYRLGSAESEPGVLDVQTPWLGHPTDASLNRPVVLVDDDGWEWEAPGTVHEPVDSEWPVVVWGPRTRHTGQLLIETPWAERADVEALLRDGSPWLLRVPPGCAADTGWVWVSRARRDKTRRHDPAAVRWTLNYQRVRAPGGTITQDPSNAWAGVPLSHPDWTDVAAEHPDWIDVQLTPHPHVAISPPAYLPDAAEAGP